MSTGELRLLEWFRDHLRRDSARVPVGIGDDMAALRLDGTLVTITCDMLLDGVHFDTQQHSFDEIGRKAIACSLSDCAAMGCSPRGATVGLALPAGTQLSDVQALYRGMESIASDFACPIVGGDTTSWKGLLAIDVAMLAEPMAARGPVLRSTARPGDRLYVSGPLGGSILGRHLSFMPRLALAEALVTSDSLHAMMDLSDGLSLDLHRLCTASGCNAELEEILLPRIISDSARVLAKKDGRAPLEHALSDGEDFELLIAGDDSLGALWPELRPVGRIVARGRGDTAMTLIRADGGRDSLEPKGYEHLT